jgi:hypothetical protein
VLRDVRVGDQIHFRGYLAEYSHHHEFAWLTVPMRVTD